MKNVLKVFYLKGAQEEREKMLSLQGASTMDPDVASTIIQKVWKGYSQRNKTLKLREEELIFIGMQPNTDTQVHHKDSPVSKVNKREVRITYLLSRHLYSESYKIEFMMDGTIAIFNQEVLQSDNYKRIIVRKNVC